MRERNAMTKRRDDRARERALTLERKQIRKMKYTVADLDVTR